MGDFELQSFALFVGGLVSGAGRRQYPAPQPTKRQIALSSAVIYRSGDVTVALISDRDSLQLVVSRRASSDLWELGIDEK